MFSRENRRPKGAKTKICFTFVAFVVLLSSSFVVAVVVSTGCRWCRVQGLPVSCGVCSAPFVLSLALCSVHCPWNMPLFAFWGVFSGVSLVGCMFVLLACFAWLVGLLCAWVVRRIKGLRRVCSYFSLFLCVVLLFVLLSLCFCVCSPLLVLSSCLSFPALFVVSFSLTDYTQKEKGAISCVLSSCVVGCVSSVPCALLLAS